MSHPTGNQNVRAAALGLANADLVESFNTTIASFPGDWMDVLSKVRGFSQLARRRFDPEIKTITRTHPWREFGRLLALRAGVQTLTSHEDGPFCIDAVYQDMDRNVARQLKDKGRSRGIYAYEDGAFFSFQQAKQLGMQCLYDLPIGYWRSAQRILHEEGERWPAWASTLTGLRNSHDKLQRKDGELRMADRIYVASKFTATTLLEFPGELAPVDVIPYGFPSVPDEPREATTLVNRKLKVLFVGGLSQRKGLAYLFAAVKKFRNHVSLTVVGKKPVSECEVLNKELMAHTWIPDLPHREVLRIMRAHDVLVFPSLFEGFGLVITEAMSQGTPVITTDRTAGPEFIEHGRNGWLMEAGSTDALVRVLEEILERPSSIRDAGHQAMDTARNRPWRVYGQELADSIKRTLLTKS